MNRRVLKQLETMQPGSMVRVDWCDASTGKSLTAGGIDVPARTWGIFLGLLGQRNKHVVVCQNAFHYTNDVSDVDYTAIPAVWTVNITLLIAGAVPAEEASHLLKNFLQGHCRTAKRRTANHGS